MQSNGITFDEEERVALGGRETNGTSEGKNRSNSTRRVPCSRTCIVIIFLFFAFLFSVCRWTVTCCMNNSWVSTEVCNIACAEWAFDLFWLFKRIVSYSTTQSWRANSKDDHSFFLRHIIPSQRLCKVWARVGQGTKGGQRKVGTHTKPDQREKLVPLSVCWWWYHRTGISILLLDFEARKERRREKGTKKARHCPCTFMQVQPLISVLW